MLVELSSTLFDKGLWKIWNLMLSHYPDHWSCSLNRLAAEYAMFTTWVIILKSGQDWSPRCQSRWRSSWHMAPSRWSAALPLHCCLCLCTAFAIIGWVVNRNNNFDHAIRIKLNAQTSYDTGIYLNICRLQSYQQCIFENLKYCQFVSVIIYVGESCQGIVLSGNVLSGKCDWNSLAT